MKRYCDLHVHSKYSTDGQHTIIELARLAKKRKLAAMIVTDHNEIAGTFEFGKIASEFDIETITGVELSTRGNDQRNIHILLYKIKRDKQLLNVIDSIKNQYEVLTKLRIEKLNELGFHIEWKNVLNENTKVPSLGPTLGAAVLHNNKNKKDPRLMAYRNGDGDKDGYNFYCDYLRTEDTPAYIEFKEYSSVDALRLAEEIKSTSVFAHPGYSLRRYDRRKQEEFIKNFVENGLKGIEVFSSHHSKDDVIFFTAISKKWDLLVTGGSDFHGEKNKPGIKLGCENIPYKYFSLLKRKTF